MDMKVQVSALQDDVNLLKNEIKTVLKELRTAVLSRDNPFSASTGQPPLQADASTASASSDEDKEPEEKPAKTQDPAPTPSTPPLAGAPGAPPGAPPAGMAPGVPAGMAPGAPPAGMAPGAPPAGMAPGMPPGMAPGMPPGMAPGMPPGMAPGAPSAGMAPGAPPPAAASSATAEDEPPARASRGAGRPKLKVVRQDEEEPPEQHWNLLTVASLASWAEEAVETLGLRSFQIVLELACFADLLTPKLRDVMENVGRLSPEQDDDGLPMNINECLVLLRQLEAIVCGGAVEQAPHWDERAAQGSALMRAAG